MVFEIPLIFIQESFTKARKSTRVKIVIPKNHENKYTAVQHLKCILYCENIGGRRCARAKEMVLEISNPCSSYLQCSPDALNVLHWIKHFCPNGKYPSLNDHKCILGKCPYDTEGLARKSKSRKHLKGYDHTWNSDTEIPWDPRDKTGCVSSSLWALTNTRRTTTMTPRTTSGATRKSNRIPINIIATINRTTISRLITNRPDIVSTVQHLTSPNSARTTSTESTTSKIVPPNYAELLLDPLLIPTNFPLHNNVPLSDTLPDTVPLSDTESIPDTVPLPETVQLLDNVPLPEVVQLPNSEPPRRTAFKSTRITQKIPIHISANIKQNTISGIITNPPDSFSQSKSATLPETAIISETTTTLTPDTVTNPFTLQLFQTTPKRRVTYNITPKPSKIPINVTTKIYHTTISRLISSPPEIVSQDSTKKSTKATTTSETQALLPIESLFKSIPDTIAIPTSPSPTHTYLNTTRKTNMIPIHISQKLSKNTISRIITNPPEISITGRTTSTPETPTTSYTTSLPTTTATQKRIFKHKKMTTRKTTTTHKPKLTHKTKRTRKTITISPKKTTTTLPKATSTTTTEKVTRFPIYANATVSRNNISHEVTSTSRTDSEQIPETMPPYTQEVCSEVMKGIVGRRLFSKGDNCQMYWECKWRPFMHQWMIIYHTCDVGMYFLPSLQICTSGTC